MNRTNLTALAVALALAACSSSERAPEPPTAPRAIAYPKTRTVEQSDVYHGVRVADPYRWLEDDEAEATKAWVRAENELSFGWLEQIQERDAIAERLKKLWSYERYEVPELAGGKYFFSKNDGLQNQAVLYVASSIDQQARVLLDPNALSKDGTVALQGRAVSDDGRLVAYGLSTAGSDWQRWRVRDVESGRDLDDAIDWVKFSGVSWTKDARGFFYSRYPEPAPGQSEKDALFHQKLYFHALGTKQKDDRLVYARADEKEWGFSGLVTDDGRYLIISVWKGTDAKNQIFYEDLAESPPRVRELVSGFANGWDFLANDGTRFLFKTDRDAPRGRIVSIDASAGLASLREVVPQEKDAITSASVVGDALFIIYLSDAHSRVRVVGLDGKRARDVALPGLGTAFGFGGRRKDRETFFGYTDATTPTTIFRYDLATGASSVVKKPKLAFDASRYESRQFFATSKDGTRVPLSITAKKGVALDGSNPTLLYGYGGFDISLTPEFSPSDVVWLELGGVYVVANLRGGGEYGEEWHKAGTRARKQNVFDDFQAAAQWLVANKWTRPEKLAIQGESNGGLLVGACVVQRPELFGAALCDVGVLDMLRFQKFTIGWAWVDDYGSSDDASDFAALRAYSPYHNARAGVSYPATLITTGDHDDRVVPGHSFKFAAALQAAQAGPAPILLRVEVNAGHGAGKPIEKVIATRVDQLAFLVRALGVAR